MSALDDELDERQQRARAARETLVGKTIAGRYILRGLVGHGGMGAVYEAEHVGLGKRVAIKFVDPEFATDEQVVARFAREARAMSAIESAHIVTVIDAGSEDGRPYLVMELLRGEDLGQRLRRLSRIPLQEAMHVVAQVLKGLARAHGAGIIHRDLKPDNVFLVKDDRDPLFAKIVDFGISKIERPRANTHPLALTGRGTVLGTPYYMSPEQAQAAADVDSRTDLYSVGAILFECLTGRPPHTGESYEQVILSICMRDAPDPRKFEPSVPLPVSELIARALSRNRAQRFNSAEGMLAALHEVAPEERARVPLDEPPPDTIQTPFAKTMLAGSGGDETRASEPPLPEEISAATKLGVGTMLSPGGDTPAPARALAVTPAPAKAPAPAKPERARGSNPDPKRPSSGSARSSSSSKPAPQKRPLGIALITALIATATGVGVTFTVISMLDKKPPSEGVPSASASARPTIASGVPSAAVPSAAPDASANAAPSASSISSPSTASAKPGTPSSTRPTGSAPAVPRPTSTKPLDINRELP